MIVNANKTLLAMARACMTTKQLAERSQLTAQGVNNIIRGKHKSTPATIGKIAKALGVDPADIIKD